ncbi:MAG: hypothetical protein WC759_04475 [Candidatus Micrarchaeia archaeon]|jgi:hypothetical protein
MRAPLLALSLLLLSAFCAAFTINIFPLQEPPIVSGLPANFQAAIICNSPDAQFKDGDLVDLDFSAALGTQIVPIKQEQIIFEDGCSHLIPLTVNIPANQNSISIHAQAKRSFDPIYTVSETANYTATPAPSDPGISMQIEPEIQNPPPATTSELSLFSPLGIGIILLLIGGGLMLFGKKLGFLLLIFGILCIVVPFLHIDLSKLLAIH